MTWLQHTQSSLSEKVSRAENFYSHTLLRQSFRNWLKVCLHPSGKMIPGSQPLPCFLFTTTTLHMYSSNFAGLLCPYSSTTPFPSSEAFFQLSTLHRPPQPRTLSYILFPTSTFFLFPCSLLIFLHYCLCCPPQASSVCVHWAGGGRKKPFSPRCLPSPVQGLYGQSRRESEYAPCSLPQEEILLRMV